VGLPKFTGLLVSSKLWHQFESLLSDSLPPPKVSWASDAHLQYLLSEQGRSHYKLVALLNSSVKAAKAAQEECKLDPSLKVYGGPNDLAADPNVDLVVVNTRADVHFSTAEPSIRAGKALYIEWPLAEKLQ
jgi:predicted dehydrogenase